MDSGMISKIQKAIQYASQPERVKILGLSAMFHGNHSDYQVSLKDNKWQCECHFFQQRGVCSHTMAIERLLEPKLTPQEAPEAE